MTTIPFTINRVTLHDESPVTGYIVHQTVWVDLEACIVNTAFSNIAGLLPERPYNADLPEIDLT